MVEHVVTGRVAAGPVAMERRIYGWCEAETEKITDRPTHIVTGKLIHENFGPAPPKSGAFIEQMSESLATFPTKATLRRRKKAYFILKIVQIIVA